MYLPLSVLFELADTPRARLHLLLRRCLQSQTYLPTPQLAENDRFKIAATGVRPVDRCGGKGSGKPVKTEIPGRSR
jgi:hypothetical protein